MKCPMCRAGSRVLDKKDSCQAVHRKLECKECGFIFYSYERVLYDGSEYLKAARRYAKKRKDAKK